MRLYLSGRILADWHMMSLLSEIDFSMKEHKTDANPFAVKPPSPSFMLDEALGLFIFDIEQSEIVYC